MSASRRMATMPWPVILLLSLALCGAGFGLLAWVYSAPDDPNVVVVAGVALLAGAVAAPVVAVVRRRRLQAAGRWEAHLDAMDAFARRQVPGHPAVRFELARLAAQQRSTLWAVRWGWALFGGLAAITVPGALDEPRKWAVVGWFAGLAVAYPFFHRRIRGQVEAAERASA